MVINEIIFDLETQKLFDDIEDRNPAKLGLSIISLYKRTLSEDFVEQSGQLLSFWEKDLNSLWPHLFGADRIIGFNSLHFDIPVLQAYTNSSLGKLPHLDILEEVKQTLGRRLSLNNLAKATLNENKIDSGLNAVLYYYQGDQESLKKLKKYCEADVLVTKELYDYVLKYHRAKFLDKADQLTEIELDFSYPKNFKATAQEKLF